MRRIRVMLADDHLILTEGLRELLTDKYDVVATVSDGRQLLETARRVKPDIIITDISMPLLNGLEAVRKLKAEGIRAKVIVLTMHREAHLAEDAFRSGVSGYLLKDSAGDELVAAIQQVFDGNNYLTPLIAKDLLTILMEAGRRDTADSRLTPRQREVLQLVVEGRTMKEVAALLNISARTAESHKYEMMQALGIETTAELIQFGLRSGMFGAGGKASSQSAMKAGS